MVESDRELGKLSRENADGTGGSYVQSVISQIHNLSFTPGSCQELPLPKYSRLFLSTDEPRYDTTLRCPPSVGMARSQAPMFLVSSIRPRFTTDDHRWGCSENSGVPKTHPPRYPASSPCLFIASICGVYESTLTPQTSSMTFDSYRRIQTCAVCWSFQPDVPQNISMLGDWGFQM